MSNDLYKGQCGSCKNYLIDDLRGADRDGYGCKYQGKIFGSPYYKRFPFDYSCGGYKKDYNRSDKDIDKALKAPEFCNAHYCELYFSPLYKRVLLCQEIFIFVLYNLVQ